MNLPTDKIHDSLYSYGRLIIPWFGRDHWGKRKWLAVFKGKIKRTDLNGFHKIGFNFFGGLCLKITQRLWNSYISIVLTKAYNCGVINSQQLHTLAAQFDPTQKQIIGNSFGIETELRESKAKWQR